MQTAIYTRSDKIVDWHNASPQILTLTSRFPDTFWLSFNSSACTVVANRLAKAREQKTG